MAEILYFPTGETADLKAVGLKVSVPKGAKFINHGYVVLDADLPERGYCVSQYDDGNITVEIAVDSRLPKIESTFVQGHEEGHALLYLGHLTALKKDMDREGIELDFMTDAYCQEHDEATRFFLTPFAGSVKHYEIARGKSKFEREMIAHATGLVALIKSSADQRIVSKLQEQLKQGNMNLYPNSLLHLQ
jgi:hypothetical protein